MWLAIKRQGNFRICRGAEIYVLGNFDILLSICYLTKQKQIGIFNNVFVFGFINEIKDL
jgi:hypothetical protein